MKMANGNGVEVSMEAAFGDFEALRPLILEEWPAVDADRLVATEGEVDKVVSLVATETEHTRAMVRKQLAELEQISSNKAEVKRRVPVFDRLEKRARALASELEVTMRTEKAVAKAKQNFFTSLLMALGVGVLLGVVVGAITRGRR